MKNNTRKIVLSISLIFLLVCGTSLIVLPKFLDENPDPHFWLIPLPPIPAYALNVHYYGGGSLGGDRHIEFETDRTANDIQQFYRTELPIRGWSFLCSPTRLEEPDCPLGLMQDVESADAYQRSDEPGMLRAINIEIYKPGQNLVDSENRLVLIVEYSYPLRTP